MLHSLRWLLALLCVTFAIIIPQAELLAQDSITPPEAVPAEATPQPPSVPEVSSNATASENTAVTPSPAPAPVTPDSTGAVYELIPRVTILASRLRAVDPNAKIIEPGGYRKKSDGLYEITKPLTEPLPSLVYLKVQGAWVLPAPEQPLEFGEFKAVQIKGTVQVQKPPFTEPATDLVEGQTLESGQKISTGEKSSVAILLPASQSIRLGPLSTVVLEQTAAGVDVTTNVELLGGSVFSRVGKRKKGTTDFRVKTPKAVAAARGTEFVTFWRNETAITCTAEGSVEVLKPNGEPIGAMRKVKLGNIGFRAEPPINEGEYASVVDDMFTQIDAINPTTGKPIHKPIVYYLAVKTPGTETPAALVEALKKMPVYVDDSAKAKSPAPSTEDRVAQADAIHQPTWMEKLMTPPMLFAAVGFVVVLILLIGLVVVLLKKK